MRSARMPTAATLKIYRPDARNITVGVLNLINYGSLASTCFSFLGSLPLVEKSSLQPATIIWEEKHLPIPTVR